MVTAAHRYCLKRLTGIADACAEWLKRWWSDFDSNTRRSLVKDTVEALQDNAVGLPKVWHDFGNWAWDELNEGERKWVKDSVAHRCQPWPLKAVVEHMGEKKAEKAGESR
jgi:hypothetical protein